jgi:hypothetical protein
MNKPAGKFTGGEHKRDGSGNCQTHDLEVLAHYYIAWKLEVFHGVGKGKGGTLKTGTGTAGEKDSQHAPN